MVLYSFFGYYKAETSTIVFVPEVQADQLFPTGQVHGQPYVPPVPPDHAVFDVVIEDASQV